MSIQSHSMVSRALTDAARTFGLRPFDVRVLVTLRDMGGQATSDRLQAELHQNDGSNIRRSLLALRPLAMLTGGDVRGQREPIVLLAEGLRVVGVFDTLLNDLREVSSDGSQ